MHSSQAGIFRSRGFTRGELLGLLAAVAAIGAAFHFFGRPYPPGPYLTAPDAGVVLQGNVPTTPVTFEWNHGGSYKPTGGYPLSSSFFILCVYQPSLNQECRFPDEAGNAPAADYVAFWKAEQMQRTVRTNVAVGMGGGTPYAYSQPLDLRDDHLDTLLRWTVGACARRNRQFCTFSEPRPLMIVARNMHTDNVSDTVSSAGNTVDITVQIDSTGLVDTGPFRFQTSVWEVLANPSGVPLTDVNALMNGSLQASNWTAKEGQPPNRLDIDDAVILDGCEVSSIMLLDLTAEGRDDSKVWAILKPNGARAFWHNSVQNIDAMTSGLKFPPCPQRQQSPSGICRVTAAAGQRPTAFAACAWIDPDNYVPEYDETDNDVAENNIRMP